MRIVVATLSILLFARLAAFADEPKPASEPKKEEKKLNWKPLFDGKNLGHFKKTEFGGDGEVKIEKGQLILEMGQPLTGVTWDKEKAKELPTDNYEITLEAMKVKGDDFFCGLTFPCRDSHCSFICGGWAGGIVGISSINGQDASENETTKYRTFKHNQWYKIRVRVSGGKLRAWIDDEQYVDVELDGKKIDTRFEVDINKPLGLSCYQTTAAIRNFKIRTLEKDER
jgi:3-keto-disaccharide hydrolase